VTIVGVVGWMRQLCLDREVCPEVSELFLSRTSFSVLASYNPGDRSFELRFFGAGTRT
jgi:hypothetical protein